MQRTASLARGLLVQRSAPAGPCTTSQAGFWASHATFQTRHLSEEAHASPLGPLWHSGHGVADLHQSPTGKYFTADPSLVAEAGAEFYEEAYLKKEGLTQPNYGATGVQREFEASGQQVLLHRPVIETLLGHARAQSKRRISLQGWTGSGKSVALYSLVSWARTNGWIALYVPSAFSMVQGGTFNRGEDGLYDMPQGARYLLQAMLQAHGADLAALPAADGAGSLADLASEGLKSTTASVTVGAAIALKDALAQQAERPVLLAVDDYNALYHRTVYGEAVHPLHRRLLRPDELRLVRGFRVMEQPAPVNGLTVTAPTCGGRLPAALAIPLPKNSRLAVPRLSMQETATTAAFYYDAGLTSDVPDVSMVQRAFALCNGNGRELRHRAAVLLSEKDPLGHSLGHKAQDAAKRRILRGEA